MIVIAGKKFKTTPDRIVQHIAGLGIEARRCAYTGKKKILVKENEDLVVNWGCDVEIQTSKECKILNSKLQTKKVDQLSAMEDEEVNHVPFAMAAGRVGENYGYPTLARKDGMHGGVGIKLCKDEADENKHAAWADFFSLYIPKKAEFRVHVACGQAIAWVRKKPGDGVDETQIAWNHEKGFIQTNWKNKLTRDIMGNIAVSTCKAVGYDFGAVDMIMDDTGTYYVLEVNSAPALDVDERLSLWCEQIIRQHPGNEDFAVNRKKEETE